MTITHQTASTPSIVLERDIPIPERRVARIGRYPVRDMKIGESFWAPVKGQALDNATAYYRTVLQWRFTIRSDADGARIWRIA